MEFRADAKETVILDNRNDELTERTIPSEIRFDPLTGRTSRICHFMKLSWPKPDFRAMVEGTERHCPFCPETLFKVTPLFPRELIPEGRFIEEDRVITPNIAPYDGLSFVAVMSSRHFIPMLELAPDLIFANLKTCLAFFRRIHETGHTESIFHLINWNYMPPAGSSLIHPHLQVFATGHAPNLLRSELMAAREYRLATGRDFWRDYLEREERDGRRFLGRLGRTAWLVSYAPMGVAGDVIGLVEDVSHTLALEEEDLWNLAQGIGRALSCYDEMGIYSFNMNLFTNKVGEDGMGLHVLLSPRTFFNQALGTPDVGALRNLYNETLCMAFPEEIAETIRPAFQ